MSTTLGTFLSGDSAQRFGAQVRAAAERRNRTMRRDDMAATRAAFESPDPRLWELGDLLLDMREAQVPWPQVARVREAIFEEVTR